MNIILFNLEIYMKERRTGERIRMRLARVLLFPLLAFTCIGFEANAQGWTFTPQLKFVGDCEGAGAAAAQANAMLSGLGNLSLPSKSMCESLRQQVLAIQVAGGDCFVGYTCTPCTGADISSPAGVTSAGTVSFTGQYTGEPLFSPHESLTRENYGIYYKQMQDILGFSSYLGSALMPVMMPKVPTTGDKPLDDSYARLAAEYNPTPYDPYSQDASVVDLRHLGDDPGVVQLLTNEEEQRKRDEWYQDKLSEQGFSDLAPLTSEGITDEGSTWNREKQDLAFAIVGGALTVATVYLAVTAGPTVAAVGITATLFEEVGLVTAASWALPVIQESVNAIQDCYTGNCPTTSEILVNMADREMGNIVGTAGSIVSGAASVVTQKAIGTVSSKGVNAVKNVWDASFGLTDSGKSVWEAWDKFQKSKSN